MKIQIDFPSESLILLQMYNQLNDMLLFRNGNVKRLFTTLLMTLHFVKIKRQVHLKKTGVKN